MVETVAEGGYDGAPVAVVVARAEVSRQTFYESFANREDCYRAAYEACFEFLCEQVSAAPECETWSHSVRARLSSLLEALASHPGLASFFLISPLGVSEATAARHHQAFRDLVEVLVGEAPELLDDAAEIHAQAFAGGLSRLAGAKADQGLAEELPLLLPDLVELFRIMAQ